MYSNSGNAWENRINFETVVSRDVVFWKYVHIHIYIRNYVYRMEKSFAKL